MILILEVQMLVSLGSALFTLIAILLTIAQTNLDAFSRIIQNIITGVGFLGAGEIFRETRSTSPTKYRIRGLTWCCCNLDLCQFRNNSRLWIVENRLSCCFNDLVNSRCTQKN